MGGRFLGTSWSVRPRYLRRCKHGQSLGRSKSENRFAGTPTLHGHGAHHLADSRAMLESMAAAAAGDPNVGGLRMAVQNKVAIGRLLVLADARFHQRGVFQRGKAQRDVFAGFMQFFRRGDAVDGGGIDLGPAAVIGNLETAPLVSRDSVEGDAVALFHPDGQLLVAETPISGGRTEEKNFLTSCTDELRQLGKNLA